MEDDACTEPGLQLIKGGAGVWVDCGSCMVGLWLACTRGQALDLAHGHAGMCDAASEFEAGLWLGDGEQGASVPCGKTPLLEQILKEQGQ